MKKLFLLFVLSLACAVALQVLFACDDDDDDNNDNNDNNDDNDAAPLIPHGEQGANCQAAGCHDGVHDGDRTNDECLGCHAYAD